ncbi:MAG: alpha-glucosidase [Flavobacteriales bacterium]|nr:MAG: alpha-glucosidase [Flavobacteriales bacterium]
MQKKDFINNRSGLNHFNNKILTLRFLPFLIFIMLSSATFLYGQNIEVKSPDERLSINIEIGDAIKWSVKKNEKTALDNVEVAMKVNTKQYGVRPKLQSKKERRKNEVIEPVVPFKNKVVANKFNELVLKFKGNYSLEFRVYNEGVAYRWITNQNGEIKVYDETVNIKFSKGTTSYLPVEESTYSHYEREYIYTNLDTVSSATFASLPLLWENKNGIKVLFSEADLYDYPNLFLEAPYANALRSKFPKAVLEVEPYPSMPDRKEQITAKADYIALTTGKRSFPWRFFVIAEDDKAFLETNMVLKLSRPLALKETNWIHPGKVAWDWYNANNIFGVDFKSGLNIETYKYYIDFAAKYGLDYIILDEGWSKTTTDILHCNPNIDVKALISYGKEKNVGIILWCLWKPLDENLNEILDTYAAWGARGIKVDFMQRADQDMVNYYAKIAQQAAKRKMLVDFHGAYKPAGLRRAYPNVLAYEGVKGAENNKWEQKITPGHNTILPFIRMAVGPMDYTPGAMRNAHPKNHNISFERPVSLGTRAHQVAMYVVYESGLQMLCDTPSAYLQDGKTVHFIAQIPVTWDNTIALKSKIGEYVALAREKDGVWYIGVMNNSEKRELNIDCSFLPSGNYNATIFSDGINANTYAEDYKITSLSMNNSTKLNIQLAAGGGWTAIIKPVE